MITRNKGLLLMVCAVLLVGVSVFGTLAYLTSTKTVTNTFTIGKVEITLDEAKVDPYGAEIANADRVTKNEYKLIPGHAYKKDPIIHFADGSEPSYLFVKVGNGIAGIEADKTIENQMKDDNGWEPLVINNQTVSGVYFKQVPANTTGKAVDYVVFSAFKLTDTAEVASYKEAKIEIKAYAVQADGFDTAGAAWDIVKSK